VLLYDNSKELSGNVTFIIYNPLNVYLPVTERSLVSHL